MAAGLSGRAFAPSRPAIEGLFACLAKAGAAAVLALGATAAFAKPDLTGVTLPPGFKIEVWTDQVPLAREIALGDKGTVFVGSKTFFKGDKCLRYPALNGHVNQIAHPFFRFLQFGGEKFHQFKRERDINIQRCFKKGHPDIAHDDRLQRGSADGVHGFVAQACMPKYFALLCKPDDELLFVIPALVYFNLSRINEVYPGYRVALVEYLLTFLNKDVGFMRGNSREPVVQAKTAKQAAFQIALVPVIFHSCCNTRAILRYRDQLS